MPVATTQSKDAQRRAAPTHRHARPGPRRGPTRRRAGRPGTAWPGSGPARRSRRPGQQRAGQVRGPAADLEHGCRRRDRRPGTPARRASRRAPTQRSYPGASHRPPAGRDRARRRAHRAARRRERAFEGVPRGGPGTAAAGALGCRPARSRGGVAQGRGRRPLRGVLGEHLGPQRLDELVGHGPLEIVVGVEALGSGGSPRNAPQQPASMSGARPACTVRATPVP